MLIRSQDKKKITTSLDLEVFNLPHSNEYRINAGEVGYIGTYSTEEKAIKVLDMIQDAYERKNVFQMPNDGDVCE